MFPEAPFMEAKVKIEHKHGPTCLRGEKQQSSVTTEAHDDVHSSFRMADCTNAEAGA